MELLKIIESEIDKINKYNIGPNGKKIFTDFEKGDYDYILKYQEVYYNNFSIPKFMSFCYKNIWDEISNLNIKKSLWEYKTEEKSFLKAILNRLSIIIEVYTDLIRENKNYDALVVFRSYMELSSILFACTLDFEFYYNYIKELADEDYLKHWFKKLKPAVVKKTLKNLHVKANKKTNNENYDNRYNLENLVKVFVGKQKDLLYEYTSSISHGKYNILKHAENKVINDYLIMATDFLANTTTLLGITTYDNLEHKEREESKHNITSAVWFQIYYNHILKR
ncbi:MAG: hypothetical protein HN704_13310 [Bacteroidetes bacterium]|jgi:hypothetical protein|nr:hypothetical protein [Bacteroidota bacterium]MBT6686878.1 hypothetical protein [Bacteroidota bacterium]MBT7142283.1 hypothetical protein [Bacteroidota bacterium]MBT7492575.1 hypothetical protein [Bacteroidota bacterium]